MPLLVVAPLLLSKKVSFTPTLAKSDHFPDVSDPLLSCLHVDGTATTCSKRAMYAASEPLGFRTLLKERTMKRKASAVWQGGLKDGKGTISTDSGVLSNTQYSFGTRFEDGKGTNPEELIAAAHAGCFSMALSAQLGEAKLTAESINTTSTVTLEKDDKGFAVTEVHLDVVCRIPGADEKAFMTAADNAKTGCPISRLFNAKITMNARLETKAAV